MKRIKTAWVLTLAIVLCVQFRSFAEEGGKEAPPSAAQQRLDYMYNSAAGFVGARSSDGAAVKIYEKPLLRFTNPLHGCREGLFVAWVDETNRPVAVGQVFLMRSTTNDWYIETQSVSDGPVELRSPSNGSWSPSQPGIKWETFKSNAPKPSESKALRLAQMRRLASRFRVDDSLTGEEHRLRLMSNPMIRYEDPDKEVLDGALFAFVQGTDPELLVQLELREDEKGNRKYYWALAAMTSAAVKAYLDDQPVWSKERSSGGPNQIFYMRRLTGGVSYPFE